jgi:hypothetical protein
LSRESATGRWSYAFCGPTARAATAARRVIARGRGPLRPSTPGNRPLVEVRPERARRTPRDIALRQQGQAPSGVPSELILARGGGRQ